MDPHGDSSDRQSSEQTQPMKRFGWKPLYEPSSVSSTPSRIRQPSTSLRNSVLKTPEKSRTVGIESSNTLGLQNQKRTSDSVSNTSGPTPNSKGLRYIAKRDRTAEQSPSVTTYHSPSLVRNLSPGMTPTRTRTPISPSTHRTSASYSLHSPSGTQVFTSSSTAVNQWSPGSRSSVPSRSPALQHRHSSHYHVSPHSQMSTSNSQQQTPPQQSTPQQPILEEEEPLIPPELEQRLLSDSLVELTPQPERGALSNRISCLQEIEEVCRIAAVMKVRNPVTKLKERIAELDSIIENVHNVLRDVLTRCMQCIRDVESIERSFICYISCVRHNREVSEKEQKNLEVKNAQVIEEVSALNTTYMQYKEELQSLQNEVGVKRINKDQTILLDNVLAEGKYSISTVSKESEELNASLSRLQVSVDKFHKEVSDCQLNNI